MAPIIDGDYKTYKVVFEQYNLNYLFTADVVEGEICLYKNINNSDTSVCFRKYPLNEGLSYRAFVGICKTHHYIDMQCMGIMYSGEHNNNDNKDNEHNNNDNKDAHIINDGRERYIFAETGSGMTTMLEEIAHLTKPVPAEPIPVEALMKAPVEVCIISNTIRKNNKRCNIL